MNSVTTHTSNDAQSGNSNIAILECVLIHHPLRLICETGNRRSRASMQRSAACRSVRELSSVYFLVKFRFDTAESDVAMLHTVCGLRGPNAAGAGPRPRRAIRHQMPPAAFGLGLPHGAWRHGSLARTDLQTCARRDLNVVNPKKKTTTPVPILVYS